MIKKIVIIWSIFLVVLNSLYASELIDAIISEDLELAKSLVQPPFSKKKLKMLNAINHNEDTALTICSRNGHEEIAEMLIKAGVDINITGICQKTALIMACIEGHKKIVQMLIRAGANINIQHGLRETALINASLKGHKEIVQMLIDANVDLNVQNVRLMNALIIASVEGHKEIVQMLIRAGANINIQSNDGNTALIYACCNGYKEIVEMLVDANADLNIKDSKGRSAFSCAQNKPKILSILNEAKKNRSFNCYCERLMCNSCKLIIANVPIFKSDFSNSEEYGAQVYRIIENNQMTKKAADNIIKELFECNSQDGVLFKNELRNLKYYVCKECDELQCRECAININLNMFTSTYGSKKSK